MRIVRAQGYDDTLILELRLSRPWQIHPGQHVHLSLLTLRYASIFQRHPFVITWWRTLEGESDAIAIYIMVDPRRGWTRRISHQPDLIAHCYAWLDGPFGRTFRLEEYGTVILFASGKGVFAQLPLMKSLVEQSKFSAVKTRRIKLVWQTNQYHEQLQEWMQGILDDRAVSDDVCCHYH